MGRLQSLYRFCTINSNGINRNLLRLQRLPLVGGSCRMAFSTTCTTAAGTRSTIDERERAQFAQFATQWWRARGPHAMLLEMNSIRVPFVVDALVPHAGPSSAQRLSLHQPLRGKRILDIGAGGGFLSEALARLGILFSLLEHEFYSQDSTKSTGQ